LSTFGSITNSGDGVIEGGSASSGVHNTGGVLLEDSSVGLNGDGDWSLVDGSLKLLDRVGWDVGVSSNVDETLGGIKFAGS
jgi:hypothetical protein